MRHGFTRDQLFTEAILPILAGSDTKATAVRCTMLYLMSHPRIYKKLQAEADAAAVSGAAPAPAEIVSEAITKSLECLQAVIHEGLRIHPSVSDEVAKVVPKGSDTIVVYGKPIYFPDSTDVGYSVLGLNRR